MVILWSKPDESHVCKDDSDITDDGCKQAEDHQRFVNASYQELSCKVIKIFLSLSSKTVKEERRKKKIKSKYNVSKKKKIQISDTCCNMNHEDIMLNEISQSQKDKYKYCMIPRI